MLPDEMINNIADYLEERDFRSLRNTCSSFRKIKYFPTRSIITGAKNVRKYRLRPNMCLFSLLFMTMSYIGIMFLVICIVLLCIGHNEEHTVIGSTLMALSIMLLFLDFLFILISIKVKTREIPIISEV